MILLKSASRFGGIPLLLTLCSFCGCVFDEPEKVKSAREEVARVGGQIVGGDERSLPGIIVNGHDISELDWEKVLPLKSLFMIDLSGTNFSDEDVDVLLSNPHLYEVHLEYTDIADAGVARLRKMYQIQDLNLRGCNVTDACIDDLLAMENLRYVILHETHVSKEAAARLAVR